MAGVTLHEILCYTHVVSVFQDDGITFSCTDPTSGQEGGRVCLAAEGFGNRMCFLQSMANKVSPF